MKLQEIMERGFVIRGWNIQNDPRGERRVVFKLSKKSTRGEKFYVAHTPQLDYAIEHVSMLHDMEFTEPVLLK